MVPGRRLQSRQLPIDRNRRPEAEGEDRAAPGAVRRRYGAAHPPHGRGRKPQSETVALLALGGEERLEEPRHHPLWDARAAIGNAHDDGSVGGLSVD